jgi:hypothetical protein
MTTSEWLIDALSVTEDPDVALPEAGMTASFVTDGNSTEVGTAITGIKWDGSFTDGTYEFGSKQNTTANSNANAAVAWTVYYGTEENGNPKLVGSTEDGSVAYSGYVADNTLSETLSAKAALNVTNVYEPYNNVGDTVASKKVATFKDGSTEMTFSPAASVRGYRKMFVGSATGDLDSAVIRALNLKSSEASTTAFEVTAKIGATNLVVACPTNSKGKKYTLAKAEMFTMSYEDYTDKFEAKSQVQVADARGGDNGLQNYNIYVYSFTALKADTKFKITLKSANA